jgi:SanA protein
MIYKLRKLKRLAWITFPVMLIFSVWFAHFKIEKTTQHLVYNDVRAIPYNKVGLLLGTSKLLRSGERNLYFYHRIIATFDLFKAQKIKYIVISGDNSEKDYNEPQDMKMELVKLGVPDSVIILDYAGFRTYDSVIRLNKIFGQEQCTIISQEFHNKRAIYIANQLGLNAVGFNAKDVDAHIGFKTKLRECFARVKVFLDFWVHKEPTYLGQQVGIE